ncbi:hypothetical protein EJ03DRAFT_327271 [Teratosphaeria nubilosa]|uniref:Dystroglycan-type cadherin-like domain-containing protein n=1 Tax=Teratosphaeria nubilosa TaxID=161662 RepID=A0A6G1L9Z1_9PEZI|nr:hypothetical protein EJ03DRAFT_327271 [Teratosphaeria nubilosa]
MLRPEIGRTATVALCAVIATTLATPDISFPFNSQVPTVARVGSPYLFQFSDSTFAPDTTNFTYSLSDQPNWLALNGATRTLSGTPTQGDVGSISFTLSAADDSGAAHMPCTLVVSSDPAPQLEGDIVKELAASANLSNSQPPVVTLLPSESFKFDFQQSSFVDIVQRKLYYYATLTDHTPLPSWLSFDSSTLVFSGTAPVLSAFPQSWDIDLIASDVAGFAGATASFTVSIGTEQLTFVPAEQSVNISSGAQVLFTELKSQLYLNGQSLGLQNISSAYASSLPSWLQFDNATLAVTGTALSNLSDETFSVTVKDEAGDSATATINLVTGNASLIVGSVGDLTAYSGQVFDYVFPDSLFSGNGTELTVEFSPSVTWLHFDATARKIQGTVPSQPSTTSIAATLIATSTGSDETQTQTFTINVKATASSMTLSTLTTSRLSTRASATNSSTAVALATNASSPGHLSAGVIAVIVVLSLIAAVLLIVCLMLCLRRRKRDGYELHSASPAKNKNIGHPMPPTSHVENTISAHDVERDAEKADESTAPMPPPKEADPPPQIALDLPPRTSGNRRSRWLKRFSYISQASSLANGSEGMKEDKDIPEWGSGSVILQKPHDSSYGLAGGPQSPRTDPQASPSELAMRRLTIAPKAAASRSDE